MDTYKSFPQEASFEWLEQSMQPSITVHVYVSCLDCTCWYQKKIILVTRVTVCGLQRPEFNEWVHYSISALNNDLNHTAHTHPQNYNNMLKTHVFSTWYLPFSVLITIRENVVRFYNIKKLNFKIISSYPKFPFYYMSIFNDTPCLFNYFTFLKLIVKPFPVKNFLERFAL